MLPEATRSEVTWLAWLQAVGTEERAFGHADTRPFAWLYAGAVLAGFLLSLPYWRTLGLVTG